MTTFALICPPAQPPPLLTAKPDHKQAPRQTAAAFVPPWPTDETRASKLVALQSSHLHFASSAKTPVQVSGRASKTEGGRER